ncbi:uncharacterized protein L201_002097 [Kwoniella dendrophila CBS 6074]|uniref:Uncharacterized protein n=1 Tax=Kwoniella dendrophila CBS 6074 TaxID=1295534 RepID=A0AAX4JRM2_9TREE
MTVLSPIYENPLSSTSTAFILPSCTTQNQIANSSSVLARIAYLKSSIMSIIKRDDLEPRITTKPKHRFKKIKSSITLRRIIPMLTILLIILTFTYLSIRKEPFTSRSNSINDGGVSDYNDDSGFSYTYEKRKSNKVIFEDLTGIQVPTGFSE